VQKSGLSCQSSEKGSATLKAEAQKQSPSLGLDCLNLDSDRDIHALRTMASSSETVKFVMVPPSSWRTFLHWQKVSHRVTCDVTQLSVTKRPLRTAMAVYRAKERCDLLNRVPLAARLAESLARPNWPSPASPRSKTHHRKRNRRQARATAGHFDQSIIRKKAQVTATKSSCLLESRASNATAESSAESARVCRSTLHRHDWCGQSLAPSLLQLARLDPSET
jgi:hypothetical protein